MSKSKHEWMETKKEIRERDSYMCQICHLGATLATSKLSIHHLKPKSMGGTNDPDNLITLCVDCHRGLHSYIDHTGVNPETLQPSETPLQKLKKKAKKK